MRVALIADNGQYVGVEYDRGGILFGHFDELGPWETFTLLDHGDGTVSLRAFRGDYVGAQSGRGGLLVAGSETIGAPETFRLTDHGDGTVSLQASSGQYVCAERGGGTDQAVWANRSARGPWETFRLVPGTTAWMENVYDKIKDKTLAQLCLPGTHDSGTYELFDEIAPDAEKIIRELWTKLPGPVRKATGIREFIKGMAVAQSKTFYDQFQDGIRYIDLRICRMHGQFFTCHSLRGNLISTLMEDVKQFLDENPKEVILFKVGFKEMTEEEKKNARSEIEEAVRPYYYEAGDARELRDTRFSELVDASHRAIFVLPGTHIHGIYSSAFTTNSAVLQNLRNQTASFDDSKLLEAQFIRPISNDDFIMAFVQKNGCRLLGASLPLFAALPLAGPILLGTSAALQDVRSTRPKPADLLQNARDSRSIMVEYLHWLVTTPSTPPSSAFGQPHGIFLLHHLARNPMRRPQLIMCDFYEEVPLVEVAIRLSTGQHFRDLLNDVRDVPPPALPGGKRFLQCMTEVFSGLTTLLGEAAKKLDPTKW